MLTMIQLTCTHCGNQFELEQKDGAVCPSCGWASTVIPSAEVTRVKDKVVKPQKVAQDFSWISGFFIFVLKFLVIAGLIGLLIWGAIHFFSSRKTSTFSQSKQSTAEPISLVPTESKKTTPTVLSPDEQALLNSKLDVPVDVQLSDQDQNLLQYSVDLTAGNVEKLPSTNWTFAEFKEFVEKQEKAVRIPLPRSYKKSLEELFQKTYATAYDLFLAGKIQQARDVYVASMGLPVYSNDVRKHRAVVLTMLRGFLNDTIAKIGALNFTLARQQSTGLAEQVGAAYVSMQQHIRSNAWNEALVSLEKVEALLPDPSKVLPVLQAPPYVAGFEKVDGDIQPVLLKLLQVPAWTFDLNDLKGDLEVKRSVLMQLTDPSRKSSIENYNQAIQKIQAKAWVEALAFLSEVKSPEDLKQDAVQKMNLIKKIMGDAPVKVS